MIVVGMEIVHGYFLSRRGRKGVAVVARQFDAWFAIASHARWRDPPAVKMSHPKASILKAGRVVFNIKGNDFRLVTAINFLGGVVVIRFFGTHAEYDVIDAETV